MSTVSSNSSKPTVIFVHGLRTSGLLWDEQVRALTAAGYPTRVLDLPGHGVRKADRFTMDGALAALDEVITTLRSGSYVLVGLSLGGYSVLQFAARESALVADGASSGLVGVVAAACSSDPSTKPVRAYRDTAARIARLGARLRESLNRAGWSRSDTRRTDPNRFEPLPWSVVTDALTALEPVSSLAALARITEPVLLINGQWDHLRLEERRHLAALPGTELVVIPHAGHDVSLEAPLKFNRALLTFLHPIAARILEPTTTS